MPPGAQPPGFGGAGSNAVRFVFKVPRALVKTAPGAAAPAASYPPAGLPGAPAPAAFTTPTPFATPTPVPTALPNGAQIASVKLTYTPLGGRAAQPLIINLGAPNVPCAPAYGQLQCSLAQALPPGPYLLNVGVYTAPNAGGTLLGPTQTVVFTANAQRSTTVAMAVGAAPDGIAIAPAGFGVHGTQNGGFTLYGTATQQFAVTVLDQYGDAIVGPGSPAIQSAITSGSTGAGSWRWRSTRRAARRLRRWTNPAAG